jgi:diguanylate cyclase (GGDEF)-like protein/putative nucleotidyltransferase with HDIG domain
LKTSLRLYVYTMNLLGMGLVAYALRYFPWAYWLDGLIFVVSAAVVQTMPVVLKRQSNISVSWALAYAAVLLMGPLAGVLTCMSIGLVASRVPVKLKPHKTLFNVAANAIPAYLAGVVLDATNALPYHWVIEFIFVPLFYFCLNAYMVTFAIALTTGESPQKIFNQNYRWLSLNYLLLAPIGIGLFKAYEMLNVLGLFIFICPLIMARYSFKLYIDQTKKVEMHVESLERTNRLLGRKVSELAALQKHSLLMGGSLNLESTLQSLFERVTEDVPYRAVSIVWKNAGCDTYEQITMTHDRQVRMHTLADLETDMKRAFYHAKRIEQPTEDGTQLRLLCPMISQGNVTGVMTLLCSHDVLDEIDSSLDVYVSHAAAALSNAHLFERMETMASTDNLTKLYNRHYLVRKVSELSCRVGMPVTVIIMDFDNFKDINNTYGHHIGDLTLHYVATLIKAEAREFDIPVRYGGDEFALLLPNATEEMGLIVGTRLLELMREPVDLEGHTVKIGLSIGVAACITGIGHIQETVKQADKAAYVSKARGKGCLTLYSQIPHEPEELYTEPGIVNETQESESRRTITKGLLQVLKARDVETYNHSLSVATYAVWLAEQLGLSQSEIDRIKMGSLLHDIGKLGIPDEVLHKKTLLTDSDLVSMRTHPVVGHEVLKHFGNVYDSILPIVLSHHERMDGMGYPARVKAADLDTSVRIVTIADAFDTMTRDCCYRDKLPLSWAVEELYRCAGTQFDPQLVERFAEALRLHFPERHWEVSGEAVLDVMHQREALLQ